MTELSERLNRHCLSLVVGLQNNYLLKSFPASIVLNLVNNCKRAVRPRGSLVYAEGEVFNGMAHLLLAGDVRICKRYQMFAHEHAELIGNGETSGLFKPRLDYFVKPVAARQKGEFIEQDIINITDRRQESAIVDSEAALVLSIDLNLILAIDKAFSLINNISDTLLFRLNEKRHAEERIKKGHGIQTGPPNLGSTDEAAKLAKINFDASNEESYAYSINHGLSEKPAEVKPKYGFNTLITKAVRSRDRSLVTAIQAERLERTRVSNSPVLNKSLYERTSKKNRGHRSFLISQPEHAPQLGRSLTKDGREAREKDRVERIVKDRLDADEQNQDVLADDGKAISKFETNSARNEADIIIKNLSKKFFLYKGITGAQTPDLSDAQLNRIFSVAIKPKDMYEKNSLIQLFRCYRHKKKTTDKTEEKKLAESLGYTIEKKIIKPLQSIDIAKRARSRDEVGLAAISVAPTLKTLANRDSLWLKNPARPGTKTRARVNMYEDKRERNLLNRSDFT